MRKSLRSYILYVVSALYATNVSAGWFGPDNYEDCVLEKMKGQNKQMILVARKACEKKFPFEKELPNYKGHIEINWFSDALRLYLEINKNYGEYSVTRYKASFSKKMCNNIKLITDYTLTETFILYQGDNVTSVSVTNADEYKCMKTETIWGKMRND